MPLIGSRESYILLVLSHLPPVAREGKGREFYCRRITRSSIRRLNGSIPTPRRVRAFEFRCAFSLSIKHSLLKQSDQRKSYPLDRLNDQRDERERERDDIPFSLEISRSRDLLVFYFYLWSSYFKISFPSPSCFETNFFVRKRIKLELDCYRTIRTKKRPRSEEFVKKREIVLDLELDPRISLIIKQRSNVERS